MGTYAMKDAADMVFISKKTGKPVMYIDYANATSTEWSSSTVYATKKGANAVSFDGARSGKLKIDTELFSLKLLALVAGQDLDEFETNREGRLFEREVFKLTNDRQIRLSNKSEEGTLSIYKLKENGDHDGAEIVAEATGAGAVPMIVRDVAVTATDKAATITWGAVNGATGYVVYRDGRRVGQVSTTTFNDSDLTAEKEYAYTVQAINLNGSGAMSARVVVTTPAEGSEAGEAVRATGEAIKEAEATASFASGVSYKVLDNGLLQLSDGAQVGAKYVVYYVTRVNNARTVTVAANKFAESFEIYANSKIRESATGIDHFARIHYGNVKPEGSFTFSQSAKEPTSLSINCDVLPDENDNLAVYTFIED